MYQVQQQSPNNVTGPCFRCNKPGHWARSCPESLLNRSPTSPLPMTTISDEEYPAIQCLCGAGICEIKISRSSRNPGRKYYLCPGKSEKHCQYFKWCDQLRSEEIRRVQPQCFPMCSCGAGVCRIMVEENGVNAGRSYFVCPIKKGEGACTFRQSLDNSPESTSVTPEAPTSDQSSVCVSDEPDLSFEAEMQIETPHLASHENPVEEIQVQMQDDENQTLYYGVCESTERPGKRPATHPHNSISENLYPKLELQSNNAVENQMCSSPTNNVHASVTAVDATTNNHVSEDPSVDTMTKYMNAHLPKQPDGLRYIASLNPQGVTPAAMRSLFNSQDNVSFPSVTPDNFGDPGAQPRTGLLVNSSSILQERYDDSIMIGPISQAFENLAERLTNDLINLLESMSPQNHVNLRKEADCTYAALDRLQVDYGHLQVRVDEYIKQAATLSHIEQIANDDASTQELVDHYNSEKRRFDEIFKAHCSAKDAFTKSNSQLRSLCEKASCLGDGLVELNKELASCEAENGSHRDKLLQITKTMAECRESLQAASLKVSEAVKKSENCKIELSAAKAAFQKARTQLRI